MFSFPLYERLKTGTPEFEEVTPPLGYAVKNPIPSPNRDCFDNSKIC
jgi:hypothetical protein